MTRYKKLKYILYRFEAHVEKVVSLYMTNNTKESHFMSLNDGR